MGQTLMQSKTGLNDKLKTLLRQAGEPKCSVCAVAAKMDEETKRSFFDVLKSSATTEVIVQALVEEGFEVTRWTVGAARRDCVRGSKQCTTFFPEGKKKS
jgi:hypothetical protein